MLGFFLPREAPRPPQTRGPLPVRDSLRLRSRQFVQSTINIRTRTATPDRLDLV